MSEWQQRQAEACSCRGHDEYCPCQNVDFSRQTAITFDLAAPQLIERVRDHILVAMNRARVSQRQLARQLKVTEARVHEMLDGANLTLATVEKICTAIRTLANG